MVQGSLTKSIGWIVRSVQIINAILLLSLAAEGRANFSTSGVLSYDIALGIFSLLYPLSVITISIFSANVIVAGYLVLLEPLFALAHFVAFITNTYVFALYDCSSFLEAGTRNACRATQSTIAWSAIGLVIFLISTILVVVAMIIPIFQSHGPIQLWESKEPFHSHGLSIDFDPVKHINNDLETGINNKESHPEAAPTNVNEESAV